MSGILINLISPLQICDSYKHNVVSCTSVCFISLQVHDLMNWAAGLHATMMTEEKVRDAASAQTLKAEHEALKAKILAWEENFQAVVKQGNLMVQEDHHAAMVR
jgi:spectrin beta